MKLKKICVARGLTMLVIAAGVAAAPKVSWAVGAAAATTGVEKTAPAKKRLPAAPARPVTVAPGGRDLKALPTELRPGGTQSTDSSAQVVYQVLLAEMALQSGDPEAASTVYSQLARRTRDPKIIQRAIEVAGFARRLDLALDVARLWVEVEPSSVKAQQMMASVLILSNRFDELAPTLVRMLETDKEALPENLIGLNRMLARIPDRQAVFRLIDKVCASFFGLAEAHYAVGVAAAAAGAGERALAEAQRALELRPDWEMAALLQAQVLALGSSDQAINFLEGFAASHPKALDVQLHLARALVAAKRYGEARRIFDQLLIALPDNADIVYPVAILALQENDKARAEAQFKHFLTLPVADKGLAYYYLGQIAEDSGRRAEALEYYAAVTGGEQYLPALVRRARVLADLGQLDAARKQLSEARVGTSEERVRLTIAEAGLLREAKQTQAAFDLLEQTLATQPEQPDLLYESALLAEKLDRFDLLEERLRRLIELRPDSAQAYNALGFSYAERNERLPEARQLIEKALQLAPDDSFILDSLGWVLYRQGDLPGALQYLQRAYAQRNDPEIAAHLGEVLWTLGRIDDARLTLREAQQKHPANEALADAVKKFAP